MTKYIFNIVYHNILVNLYGVRQYITITDYVKMTINDAIVLSENENDEKSWSHFNIKKESG